MTGVSLLSLAVGVAVCGVLPRLSTLNSVRLVVARAFDRDITIIGSELLSPAGQGTKTNPQISGTLFYGQIGALLNIYSSAVKKIPILTCTIYMLAPI